MQPITATRLVAMTFQRRGRGGEGLSSSSVVENRFSSSSGSSSGTSWQHSRITHRLLACHSAADNTNVQNNPPPAPPFCPTCLAAAPCLIASLMQTRKVCMQSAALCLARLLQFQLAAVPRWDEEALWRLQAVSDLHNGHHCSKTHCTS